MSWFGHNTLRENVLDDCKSWQQSHGASNKDMSEALLDVLQYFLESITEVDEDEV